MLITRERIWRKEGKEEVRKGGRKERGRKEEKSKENEKEHLLDSEQEPKGLKEKKKKGCLAYPPNLDLENPNVPCFVTHVDLSQQSRGERIFFSYNC